MNATSYDMLEREIRQTYDAIWNDWFGVQHPCKPVDLKIAVAPLDASGYSPSQDLIYLPLCDGDVEDYTDLMAEPLSADEDRRRIWKQALVHEMLHEYARKAMKEPTPDGIRLREEHEFVWEPKEQHDDLFYSAIVEKASYFGLGQEEFRDRM